MKIERSTRFYLKLISLLKVKTECADDVDVDAFYITYFMGQYNLFYAIKFFKVLYYIHKCF